VGHAPAVLTDQSSDHELNLTFNFDRDIERKLGEADGTAAVRPHGGTEHLDNQVRSGRRREQRRRA
jgi:hypothetical protein